MKKIFLLPLTFIFIIAVSSCKKNDPTPTDEYTALYTEVLNNEANAVITETYKDLYENAVALKNAVDILTIGNETQLGAVKTAWINTREPWEKSEGFLYGPVDTEGIDPSIDSWPVDVNSAQAITNTLLETNNEARGFHTIEYFVWGLDGNKTAAQLTAREIEYLKAASQNLATKTQQLYYGWLATEDNFAQNFTAAGTANSIYPSQKNAIEEIVEGLVIIADEVANGKIEEPLNGNAGAAKPEAEESRFSNNSKKDFADNMRSIQNVYLGDYNTHNGKGISEIVGFKNEALNTKITAKIAAAIAAIEAINGTFTDAIENDRAGVTAAQQEVSALFELLDTELKPYISNL